MLSSKNTAVIAAAGSLKTTGIVRDALSSSGKKVLITTYTIDNLKNIESALIKENGYIPENIQLQTWFSFLLRDGVRPYQNYMDCITRITSINFKPRQRRRGITREQIDYYIDRHGHIYRDHISDFVCVSNHRSQGRVIQRMEQLYDIIFIDETQDLSGYDLDFLSLLFDSKISVKMVGDPRQSTYSTTNSQKNSQYRGSAIANWFLKMKEEGKLEIEERNHCHRCNKAICEFADSLYPDLPRVESRNSTVTGHDGIFVVLRKDLDSYVQQYSPTLLRHDKDVETGDYVSLNFGVSKGQTFDRVLIFPTGPIEKFLQNRDLSKLKDVSRAKFYVAVTRAKHSVAFVVEKSIGAILTWNRSVQPMQPMQPMQLSWLDRMA